MKKILLTFFAFIIMIFWTYNHCFSEWKNTTQYIIQYVETKIDDTKQIQEKYDLKNDEKIKNYLEKLKNFEDILKKIQKTQSWKDFIPKIVNQIKNENDIIRLYLKEKIQEQKKIAHKYSLLYSQQLATIIKKINNIISKIWKTLINKENFNTKDKQIIDILYLIKLKLNNLESITKKDFYTKKQLDNYIISNFSQIKAHFRQIRQIAK